MHKYCIMPFIWIILSSQNQETEEGRVVAKGWGVEGEGQLMFNEFRVAGL